MAINNEELMDKLTRTGMILRHIDGTERCCKKHGHHGPHGHHGHHGPMAGPHGGPCGPNGPFPPHPEGGPAGPFPPYPEGCHKHGHGHGHGSEGKCRKGHRRGQARVLAAIAMKEGINQKELAFLLGIRPQTLGTMLQKLEEHGMIERTKSAKDGRAIEVTLTEDGRKHAADIAERHALTAGDILAVLTDEEKAQLDAILDKLGAELDKYRPKPHKHHGEDEEDEPEDAED